MMHSAYKLNMQGDNIQPWHIPCPIWYQSVVSCPVLTVASWPAHRFLKEAGQVVWYSYLFQNFPQFAVIHTVKGFGVVNKAEVDVFLELSCFFDDPTGVGNLISGSSAFLKPAWTSGSSQFTYCWSLAWRILWDECSCAVVSVLWHCLSLGLEWKLQVDDRLLFYKCWNKMKYLQCVEGW